MSAAEAELEAGVLAMLSASGQVRAVLGDPARVFDQADALPVFPYLEIASHESEPRDAADAPASEHRLDLWIRSRDSGRDAVRQALAIVREVLSANTPVIASFRCVLFLPVFADVLQVRGVSEYRARLRLRAILEPL